MTRRKGNNMDILHWNSDLTTLDGCPGIPVPFFHMPGKTLSFSRSCSA